MAGGRYDGLVEALGGAPIAGTGFAIGVERIALALEAERFKLKSAPDAALIAMGDAALQQMVVLARQLRQAGACESKYYRPNADSRLCSGEPARLVRTTR